MTEQTNFEYEASDVYGTNGPQKDNESPESSNPEAAQDEKELASEGTEENQDSDGEDQDPKEPKKSRFQKRIDKLTWEANEHRRVAEKNAERVKELEERQAQFEMQQRMAAMQQQAMQHKPDPANYGDNLGQYEQDLFRWQQYVGQQQQALAQQHYARSQQTEQQRNLAMAVQNKLYTAAAQSEHDDYFEVVNNPSVVPLAQVNPFAHQAMLDVENFAEVSYYLAKNPKEVASFRGLSPVQVARKLANIESALGTKPRKSKGDPDSDGMADVSSPPPPTVKARGGAGKTDPSKMSMNDYVAWRRKQNF